jgi:salicylate hydroxylase
VFVNHLPPDLAHFGKRLVSYEDSRIKGSVQLHFADGSTSKCDVLIGCDGIKSTIREQMYKAKAKEMGNLKLLKHIKPLWTGTIAYRGLVDVEKLRKMGGEGHRAIKDPMMVRLPLLYSVLRLMIVPSVLWSKQSASNSLTLQMKY